MPERFPKQLISGYRTFAAHRLPTEQSRYNELADSGQSPEVMVIGCCDSRVSPEVIFDAGPGELFVVRNVANLVPPYAPDGEAHGVSSALEFAVQVLRIKHIVVLGHAQCGGIKALVQQPAPLSPSDFIGKWMSLLSPVVTGEPRRNGESEQDYIIRIEKKAVATSLDNLMTFPCVSIQVERGKMQLHGAYFGVSHGSLSILDRSTGEFQTVTQTLPVGYESALPHSLHGRSN
ncbi:carbonate dehydratase [Afipia carboxidovorans OM5]|uniref:Carbonic anhydrase n=1 Tax=Afipia carboxidovorans (strain ATCC 49405 / DSM 1227 / KCTC 32145 / OM5) TaxID=504832 RepID=B6JAR4_AFIC5|nr:carbonic anhydrase [Afipia carboxidovorans]ACI91427.1 carbonate dehydratase [Afipia carboxidovorans OM5]AEI01396.1 carbonate dehydratase [Afipia carboxidovorans OM4]AEI04971.1 carbonate dehydratase [Afipia carboxidovorans OM5]BEV45741.1 carbonic anhydrase [Afipia carboxidovorans]